MNKIIIVRPASGDGISELEKALDKDFYQIVRADPDYEGRIVYILKF